MKSLEFIKNNYEPETLDGREFTPSWYLPLEEARGAQETFGYLETFDRTDTCIGNSLEDYDEEKTALLRELGAINKRRLEILNELMGK